MAGNKNVLSADLQNVGQFHPLQKSLYLGYFRTDFYQSFTKMMQLGLAAKASCHLIFKM